MIADKLTALENETLILWSPFAMRRTSAFCLPLH
jgi:hypothetical protein